MITLKSAREIEAMDRAGDFLASIHIGLRELIKPGLDMWEVEEYVRRRCKEANVLPLQIGVDGSIMDYPYATCCGLNDEVAHAFPRHYILKNILNHTLVDWQTHAGHMLLVRCLTKSKI